MENLVCPLCSNSYENKRRDPVVLPKCGHTFCRICLLNMEKIQTNFKCPSCRAVHSQPSVNELPINYIVIQMLPSNNQDVNGCSDMSHPDSMTTTQRELCTCHGDPRTLWCYTCRETLCGQCLLEKHMGNQHTIFKAETFREEKISEIVQKASEVFKNFAANKAELSKQIQRCAHRLATIYEESKTISRKSDEVEKIMKTVTELDCLNEIHEVESKLINLCTGEPVFRKAGTHCHSADDDGSISWNEDPVKMDPLGHPETKHSSRFQDVSELQEWEISGALKNTAHWPKIPWEEFMSTIPVVQLLVPPQSSIVFLQLAVGTTDLGRIRIRLWGKLRRAQHFLSLCLGTFGPSYKGSKFCAVERKGQPGESLKAGDYLQSNGSTSCRGFLENLEWGGEYSGQVIQGLVGGGGGGRSESDALFIICLRDKPQAKMSCPFGEVVSGMSLLLDVVQNYEISDVFISDVGLDILHD